MCIATKNKKKTRLKFEVATLRVVAEDFLVEVQLLKVVKELLASQTLPDD
jgi:hypothetical protein